MDGKTKSKDASKSVDAATKKSESSSSSYLLQFILFLAAILIGIYAQQLLNLNQSQNPAAAVEKVDTDKLYKEISDKVRREVMEELRKKELDEIVKKSKIELKPLVEDDIINEAKAAKPEPEPEQKREAQQPTTTKTKKAGKEEKKDNNNNRVVVDVDLKDDGQGIKFTGSDKIVLDPSQIKVVDSSSSSSSGNEAASKKQPEEKKTKKSETTKVPDEVKQFQSSKISAMKPKKMWIPIPNSNGGHRRVPAIEIKHKDEQDSSRVKILL